MSTNSTEPRARSRGRRGGGRAGNTRGKGEVIEQLPWSLPINTDKPTEPLT
jgi:trimethylamine--corrinoid protein Co-methyltransferase